MKDYYKVLQLEKTATQDQIKKSFRKLAKKFHPDANPNNPNAEKVFKELNEAYGILSDENAKLDYDRKMYGHGEYAENGADTVNGAEKSNYRPRRSMSEADFSSARNSFENFFGFDPKGTSYDFNKKDEKVKPMKTADAFEAIFGKRKS